MDPIGLVCSVDMEARPLLERLQNVRHRTLGRRPTYAGLLGDRQVVLIIGGMGKANAAQTVTALAEHIRLAGIVGFGVGGAYPGSDLRVGDIAVASAQYYGDEGVDAPDGWMSAEGIGIPLLDIGGRRFYNEIPIDSNGLPAVVAALGGAVSGPFVTVSTCSGTVARGAILAQRFGAICETMEGAAYAHVAAHYSLPYLEVRGISNLVEDRDLSRWQLADAARAAAAAVASSVAAWLPTPLSSDVAE